MGLFGLNRKEKIIWDNIKPGDKVQMFLRKNDNKPYQSRVWDINEDNIYIKTPTLGEVYLEFPRELRVVVAIEMDSSESGRARFVSLVRGQEWFKESIIRIVRPKKIEWIDLRHRYRVVVFLPVQFSFVDKSRIIDDLQLENSIYRAEIKNISEGGALVVTDKLSFVKTGDFINVKLKIDSKNVLRARAKIVHIELAQAKYGLGVEWASLKDNQKRVLKEFVRAQIKAQST